MFRLADGETSYTPNDFGATALPGHMHPSPEQNDRTLYIPGRDGLLHYGADLGVRTFEIPLLVKPQRSRMDLQRKIRAFTSIFYTPDGKPRELKLYFDYEPEKYYKVKISSRIAPERTLTLSEFTLALTAYDPYAYSEQTYKPKGIVTDIQYDSGYTYETNEHVSNFSGNVEYFYENTEVLTWNYLRQYSGIYNFSSYNCPLSLEIEGSVRNPRITNLSTGKTLYLPSISNELMVINAVNYTVKVNGTNKLTGVTGDFLKLIPGDNDLLLQGGIPDAEVRYRWQHKSL